ncbi:MAG: methyltransferase domain-containing protein, partial [Candidatus Eremiobacteraeota bacterium]|nr:methyltransferase domain-containing protein [Candidatus Eremiobacteraeota bacterium]
MTDRWSADSYARNARFVADLAAPLVDDLAPRPGERILDLGCGDGAFTAMVAASGATVTGIDASPALVAAARARGIDARVEDARELAYAAAFDAVVSN